MQFFRFELFKRKQRKRIDIVYYKFLFFFVKLFVRIDADVAGALKTDGEAAEDSVLSDLFKNTLKNDKLTVKFENLKNSDVPAIIITDEYMRRYSEMGQICHPDFYKL